MEFRQNKTPKTTDQLLYGYDPQTLTSQRMNWEDLYTGVTTSQLSGPTIKLGGSSTTLQETRHRYASKEKPKEALEWMDRNVLTVPRWLYPEHITQKVQIEPDRRISLQVNTLIWYVTQPNLIKEGKYPVSEWLDEVMVIMWKPMNANDDFQNRYHRGMERTYISGLEDSLIFFKEDREAPVQADTKVSDAYLYLLQNMSKVEAFINHQLATTKNGGIDNLHYRNLLIHIKKVHKAYEGKK